MKPELQQIFDSVPEDEPRSRLELYRELILRWRRQGRTYRRIKTLLADQCSIEVSTTVLFRFVKTRSRSRKVETEPEPAPPAQPAQATSDETMLPIRPLKPRLSIEERRAQADTIRAQFAKSALPAKRQDTLRIRPGQTSNPYKKGEMTHGYGQNKRT